MTLKEALIFMVKHRITLSFRDLVMKDLQSREFVTMGVEWRLIIQRPGDVPFTVVTPIGLEQTKDPEVLPFFLIRCVEVFRAKYRERFGEDLD